MKTYCPMFWSLDQGIDYSAPILHLKDIVPSVGKRTFAFFDSHDRLDVGEILLLLRAISASTASTSRRFDVLASTTGWNRERELPGLG